MSVQVAATLVAPLFLAQFTWLTGPDYFKPANRLSGIGVERDEISDVVLKRRTELMVESQTFAILRDPQALAGAERITKLKKLFEKASESSDLPASFISSVAFLESWGLAKAESPAGPRGIMQIAQRTARVMGLRIVYATRYRYVTEKRQIRTKKGKTVTKSVRRKVPYKVLVRDERLIPAKAVPAAARYLARLEEQYGGRDWAVFAYHCGEGCTAEVRSIVARSRNLGDDATVAKAFFSSSPAYNRELYSALQRHMERDFSPTYYFRILRAEQLLRLYQTDPDQYRKLHNEYRYQADPTQRAPHRLSVWLKPEDLAYKTCDDLKREQGRSLVRAFENPKYFGFALQSSIGEDDPDNRDYYLQASPSVIGTIAYIAYETRRMHEAMKPRDEKFVPLEITALVRPLDLEQRLNGNGSDGLPTHCTGQVFDLNYGSLPPGQREALDFILHDLGWDGYLGFVNKSVSGNTYHVGASPSGRDFFSRVYAEAAAHGKASD